MKPTSPVFCRALPLVAVLAAYASQGCAPLTPNYAYQGFGAADPHRDRQIAEKIENTATVPSSKEVVVMLDTLPAGLKTSHSGIAVDDGWHHEVLGKIQISPNRHVGFSTLLGFPEYEHGAHKALCYPQTVLTWGTLTLWAFVSPSAYPCYGATGLEETAIIDRLRTAGGAAGGNLVVASLLRLPGDSKVYGANGIILRADPRLGGAGPTQVHPPAPGDAPPSTEL